MTGMGGEAAAKVQNFYRVADGLMRRIEEEAESEPFRYGGDLDPRSSILLMATLLGYLFLESFTYRY